MKGFEGYVNRSYLKKEKKWKTKSSDDNYHSSNDDRKKCAQQEFLTSQMYYGENTFDDIDLLKITEAWEILYTSSRHHQ